MYYFRFFQNPAHNTTHPKNRPSYPPKPVIALRLAYFHFISPRAKARCPYKINVGASFWPGRFQPSPPETATSATTFEHGTSRRRRPGAYITGLLDLPKRSFVVGTSSGAVVSRLCKAKGGLDSKLLESSQNSVLIFAGPKCAPSERHWPCYRWPPWWQPRSTSRKASRTVSIVFFCGFVLGVVLGYTWPLCGEVAQCTNLGSNLGSIFRLLAKDLGAE